MIKSIKIGRINLSLFLTVTLLLSLLISFTVAKYTTSVGMFNSSGRVAAFDVTVDGVSASTVNCRILATSKVSDIQKVDDLYVGNSFIEGAYQSYPVVVHNNSEVKTRVNLQITKTNNDNRIFYAILPNCSTEQDIYKAFHDVINGVEQSLTNVQDMCDTFNSAVYDIDSDSYLRLTLVVWSEHDAVFIDSNNDGIADEGNKAISALNDGIPSDTLSISYNIVQKD